MYWVIYVHEFTEMSETCVMSFTTEEKAIEWAKSTNDVVLDIVKSIND